VDGDGPQYVAPFEGEGTGMSVPIKCEWVPGRPEHLAVRGEGQGWWRAEVGGQLVGRIRADPVWGGLDATSVM
jgi:hypothetical protein